MASSSQVEVVQLDQLGLDQTGSVQSFMRDSFG
jgi:hypothetical protein